MGRSRLNKPRMEKRKGKKKGVRGEGEKEL